MFKQFKNIETAFHHVKLFTMLIIALSILLSAFAIYKSFSLVSLMQEKVYILANGKAIEAFASDRRENIPVEAKDHVRTFHVAFFSLDPDDKVIKANITKALYLADGSAKRAYDNLQENGYYANIISANISQEITVDSVALDVSSYPYSFRSYATQRIIRATSILTRSLITAGFLRNVSRSENNPHGFLIERWETIENKDLDTQNR